MIAVFGLWAAQKDTAKIAEFIIRHENKFYVVKNDEQEPLKELDGITYRNALIDEEAIPLRINIMCQLKQITDYSIFWKGKEAKKRADELRLPAFNQSMFTNHVIEAGSLSIGRKKQIEYEVEQWIQKVIEQGYKENNPAITRFITHSFPSHLDVLRAKHVLTHAHEQRV